MGSYVYKLIGPSVHVLVNGESVPARRMNFACRADYFDRGFFQDERSTRRKRAQRCLANSFDKITPANLFISQDFPWPKTNPLYVEDEQKKARFPLQNGLICYYYESPRATVVDDPDFQSGKVHYLNQLPDGRWEAIPHFMHGVAKEVANALSA